MFTVKMKSQLIRVCSLYMIIILHVLARSPLLNITGKTEEDKYILYYHNDPYAQRCWAHLRDVYYAKDKPHLKLFCAEFHKLSGKGLVTVDMVRMTINILRFKNASYFPARVDVVTYGINKTGSSDVDYYYLTEGLHMDCAYYLTKIINNADWPEFYLDHHVCGMPQTMFDW